MKFLSQLGEKDFSKEICLLRVDLNVESANDSWKLGVVVPTVEWLLARGAKVIILSHRGRPKIIADQQMFDPALSLAPLAVTLSQKIGHDVKFCPDFDFVTIQAEIAVAPAGSVFMLENLRFLPGEELNDPMLARKIASLGTLYINDAFAVSHRANASVTAIAEFLPSCAGLLFEKEHRTLSALLERAKRPLIFILGGAKTPEKMGLIKYFIGKADYFLVGGVVGNTFLKASGVDVGGSVVDENLVALAKEMLATKKIILPSDWLLAPNYETPFKRFLKEFRARRSEKIEAYSKSLLRFFRDVVAEIIRKALKLEFRISELEEGDKIYDVGAKTVEEFKKHIATAATIIWSGPLGVVEKSAFAKGTKEIAGAIINSRAFSVAGGGDTTQYLFDNNLEDKLSFISTGGGAMLEFLAGKKLPGIEALG